MKKKNTHIIEFDSLRAVTVLLLFLYHTIRIFDTLPFYIKSPYTHIYFDYIRMIFDPWIMPLLFFIAGIAGWYSLKERSHSAFFKERFQRLGIPLLFGLLLLVPPQAYIASLQDSDTELNYFEYYPVFFTSVDLNALEGFTGTFTFGHLWFLLYLLLFSLLLLAFHKNSTGFLKKKYYVLIMVVFGLLIGIVSSFGIKYPNVLLYFLFFIAGFCFSNFKNFFDFKEKGIILLSVISFIGYVLYYTSTKSILLINTMDIKWLVFNVSTVSIVFLLIVGAKKYFRKSSWVLDYLKEATLPLFILHQTIIICVAYLILEHQLNVFASFFGILLGSLIICFLTYEFVIRRFVIARMFFGMKKKFR